jgi:hypothetical protein
MTAYTRISTVKADGIVISTKTATYSASSLSLGSLDTAEKLATEIEKVISKEAKPDLFIHKNRDGSWAIATGEDPKIWPEDEKKESIK